MVCEPGAHCAYGWVLVKMILCLVCRGLGQPLAELPPACEAHRVVVTSVLPRFLIREEGMMAASISEGSVGTTFVPA